MAIWHQILRKNFTHWEALADFLELSEEARSVILKKSAFPLNLPLRLAEKCQKGTVEDPILKQFLPVQGEEVELEGFLQEPVQDSGFQKSSKLLQKYRSRTLIVTTSACAMHCRYCFRQNYPYETERKAFDEELKMIHADPSIEEVILSGGDPLSLSNQRIKELLNAIDQIDHVKRIRLHSRFMIGIPERVDDELVELLHSLRKSLYVVIHVNHPLEIDDDVLEALKRLRAAGAQLLNQSVLLQGVNDTLDTLVALSKKLVNGGVIPYYLHALDPVKGAQRFLVGDEVGLKLVQEMTAYLPGYAVPKFVREVPGEHSKRQITSSRSSECQEGISPSLTCGQ